MCCKSQAPKSASFIHNANIANQEMFILGQQSSLADCLKTSVKIRHGLTTKQDRDLEYQYAVHLKRTYQLYRRKIEMLVMIGRRLF